MVAGGKSKLPDLLGRQLQSRARRIFKRVMLVVRGELTMVDEANGLVIGRQARISYDLGKYRSTLAQQLHVADVETTRMMI